MNSKRVRRERAPDPMERRATRQPSYRLEPGSDEAVRAGCLCEELDRVDGDRVFLLNKKCPLHGFWPEKQSVPVRKKETYHATG